jgi:hypothetical protein
VIGWRGEDSDTAPSALVAPSPRSTRARARPKPTFGVSVEVSGGDLWLAALIEPPASVLEDLARYKLEIVGILEPTEIGRTAEDWLVSFDERAEIAEFDGGQLRELAELQAIGTCVLDEAMAETAGREIERFIRLLPDHIGRARHSTESITSEKFSDPGEWEISETTPWPKAVSWREKAGVMTDALTWAGTFQGIGARLLREYSDQIGLDQAFTIHDREDSRARQPAWDGDSIGAGDTHGPGEENALLSAL